MTPDDSDSLGVEPDEYALAFLRSIRDHSDFVRTLHWKLAHLGTGGQTLHRQHFDIGVTARDRELLAGTGINLE